MSMLTRRFVTRALLLAGAGLLMVASPLWVQGAGVKESELLVRLPDYCNTPDAMVLLPNGNLVLSVPNFNDVEAGAYIVQITPENQVEKLVELPRHPVTGKLVGALGICLAPSGDLFMADYQMTGERQSRVLRVSMENGKVVDVKPVITGFHVSNGVAVHDGCLYVTDTQIDAEAKPATSGVYRFELSELRGDPIQLAENETEDPHFLDVIHVHDESLPLGADGLCFDKAGNLYVSNFGDGTVHRFEFDEQGNVATNEVFARAPFMKSADGMEMDPKTNVIYVVDSRANAIHMVYPDGSVKTLAQNGDTDGLDGGMDQPCEARLRGRELIVSNMDWPVPGAINQKHTTPATLSVIALD